ncbi:ornithine-acyl-ACP acyltransferase [Rhodobacterales bacterium 52_120_T64]|nr:ornithine-acyl-ACP acyltransferase [Rhodobacterales bacterium 52_120_T64]
MAGRYTTRFAETQADIKSAQRLRFKTFRGAGEGFDADPFDPVYKHILVEDSTSGHLVCTFRLLPLANGSDIDRSYSAQFYDLDCLYKIEGMIVEMGRFCIDPAHTHPHILRAAWSAIAEFVDDNDVELLFGCSSFSGTNSDEYTDAFALLKERHLAPQDLLPKIKAPEVFHFANTLESFEPNLKAAQKRMPPLLRTYLLMGGWVSDHAVVDNEMNTLHVFTGMEIESIPANRKRFLRAIAG